MTLSYIPFYDRFFGKTEQPPSPAAQFIYKHRETVITVAISTLASYRSAEWVMLGYIAGIVAQVVVSQQTEINKNQKYLLEITDEGQTTRNDIIRHLAPVLVGTFVPALQPLTDTFVGFASGSLTVRKVVRLANEHIRKKPDQINSFQQATNIAQSLLPKYN